MSSHRSRIAGLAALTAAAALALTACTGGSSASGNPADTNPQGEIKPHEISWLLSRPADGGVIQTMQKIADAYAKDHPGFSLKLITTPDRPSYIQKYETLAAAGKLPELFDTDATPFAKKLADKGDMIDVGKLLKEIGVADDYYPAALDYQRFPDGSLYMVPFEYGSEYFWYNKKLFAKAGVEVPKSLDDFPAMCEKLRAAGVTPIALDGADQWPLERYMSFYPFREAGPDYITALSQGTAKFSDKPGSDAATWLASLGKARCFQDGFSATGYADAQALFTSGKAAVYNIGTWELSNLATDKLDATVRSDVDYFTLPTIEGSKTAANEYVTTSGIGMAINSKTFDPLVRDFLAYALKQYPAEYAATGVVPPTKSVPVKVPSNATPLYNKAVSDIAAVGTKIAVPWDTQLDPATNTRLQQELTLLVQGDETPSQFTQTMDTAQAENRK